MLDIILCIVGTLLSALPYTCVLFFIPGCAPCCVTTCQACVGGVTAFQVDISGMVNGSCTGCTNWNTTFVTDTYPGRCFGINCGRSVGFTNIGLGGACGRALVSCHLLNDGTDWITRIILSDGGGLNDASCAGWSNIFEHNHGTTMPDCTSFSSLAHPWVSGTSGCNGSGATVLLSSL